MQAGGTQNKRLNSGVFRPLRPGRWVVAPRRGLWVGGLRGPCSPDGIALHPLPLRQAAGTGGGCDGQKPGAGTRDGDCCSPGRGPGTVTAAARGCRALWEDLWLGLHPGLTSPV